MSIGQYVLQMTPKQIELKTLDSNYNKISTSLQFGDLTYKSPFARFIRNRKGFFYGQRLKLHNNLNSQAGITVIGIGKNEEQTILAKIPVNVIESVERDQTVENVFENDDIKFIYEIAAFEREISDEDYEDVLSDKGSNKNLDSEPLLTILNSDFEEKDPTQLSEVYDAKSHPQIQISRLILKQDKQKSLDLQETPRLKEQSDTNQIPELKLDQSPIVKKIETQQDHQTQNRMRRSSMKNHSSVIPAPVEIEHLIDKAVEMSLKSPSGSRVRFIQPVLEPRQTKLQSALNILLYATVSICSFFVGIYLKQGIKD